MIELRDEQGNLNPIVLQDQYYMMIVNKWPYPLTFQVSGDLPEGYVEVPFNAGNSDVEEIGGENGTSSGIQNVLYSVMIAIILILLMD